MPKQSEVNILWFPPAFHDPRDLEERNICARPAAAVSHPNLTAPGVATPINPTRTRRRPYGITRQKSWRMACPPPPTCFC